MHAHNWSKTGLWEDDKKAIYPCLIPDCPAALLKAPGQDVSTGAVLSDRLADSVKAFEGLTFEDDPAGGGVKVLRTVVIDIGAHVGVIAVYLAKTYGVTVYAFEPIWDNYSRLIHNVYNNNLSDWVYSVNKAVTGDGRKVMLNINPTANSGGASEYTSDDGQTETRESKTLADIFGDSELDRCRLLKIDSEGAEYDILLNTPADLLSRIDYIRGEFHTNKRLKAAGHKPAALRKWLRGFGVKVQTDTCKMAE